MLEKKIVELLGIQGDDIKKNGLQNIS